MANTFNVNQTPATCAEAIYNLKTLLKAAGWTVPRSSDGTTYNSSGDQITSGGSGANGMNNAKAWFVIQEPASPNRQFCFQRQNATGVNTSYLWRVKYSKGAGFTGGSPSATVVPSATDEQVLLGTGTDASPTMQALFGTSTDGGFRHNLVANDASPYGWASFAWVNTSGIPTHCIIFDPVTGGTTADTDPIVIYLNGVISASANGGVTGSGTGQWESFVRNYSKLFAYEGGTWTSNIIGAALGLYSSAGTYYKVIPAGAAVDADSKDSTCPVPYFEWNSGTLLSDWKGFSSMVQFMGVVRATGSTLSISSSKDRVTLCDIALPWDGSSTPTI